MISRINEAICLEEATVERLCSIQESLAHIEATVRMGGEDFHLPAYGKSRDGITRIAQELSYRLAWQRIADAKPDEVSPELQYIRALVDHGAKVWLAQPNENWKSFVPVMRRVGDGVVEDSYWLIGCGTGGRTAKLSHGETFTKAVQKAFVVLDQWRDQEQEKFQSWLKTNCAHTPVSPMCLVWGKKLVDGDCVELDAETTLVKGTHGMYGVSVSSSHTRWFTASSPYQAALYAGLMTRSHTDTGECISALRAALPNAPRQFGGVQYWGDREIYATASYSHLASGSANLVVRSIDNNMSAPYIMTYNRRTHTAVVVRGKKTLATFNLGNNTEVKQSVQLMIALGANFEL